MRNGTTRDFAHGVVLNGTGRIEVSDLKAQDNAGRGVSVVAARPVVTDVVSQRNGTQGIFTKATNKSVVADNLVRNNDKQGIRVRGDTAAIRRNVARNNAGLGILAPDKPGIKGKNTATGNNDGKRQCRPNRLC